MARPATDDDATLFDVPQTAEELDVTASTVRRWAREGVLTPIDPGDGQRAEYRFSEDEVARARRLVNAGRRAVQDEQRLMLRLLEEMRQVRSELALLNPSPGTEPAQPGDAGGEAGMFRGEGSWAAEARDTGANGRILPMLKPRAREVRSIRAEGLRDYAARQRARPEWLTGLRARLQRASRIVQRQVQALQEPGAGVADGRASLAGYDARGEGLGPLRVEDGIPERRSA